MPDVQDVMTLPAGRELDALIAERIFGAEWGPLEGNELAPPECVARLRWRYLVFGERFIDGRADLYFGSLRAYSTSIAAAWVVVERMRSHNNPRYRNLSLVAYAYNRTYATFDATAFADYDAATWVEANGEHATPLAICLAALKAGAAATPHEEPR